MSLIDRLIKNSTIDETSTLEDSKVYGKSDMIPTPVPMINVALSGSIDGGLTPGLTILAGPSKHFKSGFSLLMARIASRAFAHFPRTVNSPVSSSRSRRTWACARGTVSRRRRRSTGSAAASTSPCSGM